MLRDSTYRSCTEHSDSQGQEADDGWAEGPVTWSHFQFQKKIKVLDDGDSCRGMGVRPGPPTCTPLIMGETVSYMLVYFTAIPLHRLHKSPNSSFRLNCNAHVKDTEATYRARWFEHTQVSDTQSKHRPWLHPEGPIFRFHLFPSCSPFLLLPLFTLTFSLAGWAKSLKARKEENVKEACHSERTPPQPSVSRFILSGAPIEGWFPKKFSSASPEHPPKSTFSKAWNLLWAVCGFSLRFSGSNQIVHGP